MVSTINVKGCFCSGKIFKIQNLIMVWLYSAVKMFKDTGEIFVQKPTDEVPKVFTFDSVYDWK